MSTHSEILKGLYPDLGCVQPSLECSTFLSYEESWNRVVNDDEFPQDSHDACLTNNTL